MKILLVGESREGKLLETTWELFGYAAKAGADPVLFLVGDPAKPPECGAKMLIADVMKAGEYDPDLHKRLILDAAAAEGVGQVVFCHSSYGWDLAPRVAVGLDAAQVSEVIGIVGDDAVMAFEVGACNAKMRRTIKPATARVVVTIQGGAFPVAKPEGKPSVTALAADVAKRVEFLGYEPAEKKDVDLAKAEIIVSAGRGIGKKDNVPVIEALAKALGGELGASRPVVDAGWVEQSHQVGTTGQTVSPKLYVACGISGAIQHLAGMKKSEFILAINKDKDAPIGEVADVLVVADVLQFVPALTAKLG